MPRNAPAWIAARKPDELPADFQRLAHDEAIRCLRGNSDGKANGARVFHAPLTYQGAGATGVAGTGFGRQDAHARGGEHG